MKNLLILADVHTILELPDGCRVQEICCGDSKLFLGTSSAEVICISQASKQRSQVLWRTQLQLNDEVASAAPGPGSSSTPAITSKHIFAALSYVLELEAICAALSNGTLLLIKHADGDDGGGSGEGGASDTASVEEVGALEGGITALQWSPAGDVAAVADGVGRLLLLSQDWEPLAEVHLPGASGHTEPAQRFDVRLTWRGDGKYFASISGRQGDPSGYAVHVWDREGCALHATAAPATGMLPALAWQPNGRHLYVGQQQQQQNVLLYERNGLQHGDFQLPSTCGPIHQLAWSKDSELLAIASSPTEASTSSASSHWTLQVWHRSNWHWYLKSTSHWPRLAGPLLLQWDNEVASRLHCVLAAAGAYERVDYGWDSCVSSLGTAVVVDGADVLLTPLRHTIVPPPMCSARARFDEPLLCISIGDGGSLGSSSATVGDGDSGSRGEAGAVGASGADMASGEVLAGLTASGRLGVLRSVEDDLWEETLVEQQEAAAAAERTSQQTSSGSAASSRPPDLSHISAIIVDTSSSVPLGEGRRLRGLCWTGPASLLLLATPYPEPGMEDGEGDVLLGVAVQWSDEAEAGGTLRDTASVTQEGRVTYAGGWVLRVESRASGGAVVQLDTGQLLLFSPGGKLAPFPGGAAVSFPAPCPIMRVMPAPDASPTSSTGVLVSSAAAVPPAVGLTPRGELYWGAVAIAAEVTSLAVRFGGAGGTALLYTTRKSLMYVVSLAQLAAYTHSDRLASEQAVEEHAGRNGAVSKHRVSRPVGAHYVAMHTAMRPDALTAAARDVMVRAVEEGSQLIAVPLGGTQAVLQMPRGNLETVRPRPLVLAATAAALLDHDYAAAWELATTNRLDLNVVVDFRWPQFLADAEAFVSAVPPPSDVCDLLLALRPESVVASGGLYAPLAALEGAVAAGSGGGIGNESAARADVVNNKSGKINAVCAAVRRAVEPRLQDNGLYLNVVVTSYARSHPPELEAAMRCIRDAKEAELAATDNSFSGLVPVGAAAVAASGAVPTGTGAGVSVAERALRHLLLTSDADALYRVALGMYELPLAYMVIACAQRDPGEYMLELTSFAAVPDESLRRHKIDMHLQRYSAALAHLVAAGPQHFERALSLARDHGLLRELLSLVSSDVAQQRTVLEAYGTQLEQQHKLDDAAVAFIAAGCLDRAMRAYRTAGQWQMVLSLAGRQGLQGLELQQLAAEVAEELQANGQLPAAATVLEQYLGDADSAVTLLADARQWREALRVAYKHARGDLVDTVVAPAAAESAAVMLQNAREAVERIAKYLERLQAVRQRRMDMEAAIANADDEGGLGPHPDDFDAQSNASTVGGLSMYTDNTHAPGTAASSRSGSQGPASTQGGRKAQKFTGRRKKDAKQRIRQGSPQEESALVAHLLALAPSAALLQEAAQLLELLILLGHLLDAQTLQQQLTAWSNAHRAAHADVLKAVSAEVLAAATAQGASAGSAVAVGGGDAQAAPAGGTALAPEVSWKWAILRAT